MPHGRDLFTDWFGRSYGVENGRDGKGFYRRTRGKTSSRSNAAYEEPRYSTQHVYPSSYGRASTPAPKYKVSTSRQPQPYSYNYTPGTIPSSTEDSKMRQLYSEYLTWCQRGHQAEDAYYELLRYSKVPRRYIELDRSWNYPRRYDGHPKQTRAWHQSAAWFAREASDSYKMAQRKISEMGDRFQAYDMAYGGRYRTQRSSRLSEAADYFAKKYDVHLYSHSHSYSSRHRRDKADDHCVSGLYSWQGMEKPAKKRKSGKRKEKKREKHVRFMD